MENFKFVVGQASSISQYNNTSSKLLKCCANIYFNNGIPYGEVNSVKSTTINIWLNDDVY